MRLAFDRGTRLTTLQLVDVEYLENGVLHLGYAGERAALAVSPVNLALRADSEREQVWRRYRQLLASLAGPISIYFRSRPDPGSADAGPDPVDLNLATLAGRDRDFRDQLARGRTVQQQSHLLVVWGEASPSITGMARRLARRPKAAGPSGSTVDLEQRCQAVANALAGAGARARRLGDGDWLALLQAESGGGVRRGPASFASWIAPGQVRLEPRLIRLDDRVSRSLFIASYPRSVAIGWLAPLLRGLGCELRLVQHVAPVPKLLSLSRLRRKIRSFETSLVVDGLRGRRQDRGTEAALDDALNLEEKVLLEEERLFHWEICATLVAASVAELDRAWQELLSLLAELGCGAWPLTHRHVDGWRATLCTGADPLGWGREITASALATAFPFLRSGLDSTQGALLGPSLISRELVLVDPFAPANPNFNLVVLGTSGAGKSYSAKLLAARLLLTGSQVHCIDPVGEYRSLVAHLGGRCQVLAAGSDSGMSALGPPWAGEPHPDPRPQAARAMQVVALLAAGPASTAEVSEDQELALERALLELLADSGVPHSLRELVDTLARNRQARLARRLARYTDGPLAGLFDGPQAKLATDSLTVFSLAGLDRSRDQLLAPVMQMLLLHLEAEIESDPARRRLLVVDEAEVLLSRPRSAEALESLSRRVRKLGAGLMVISQVVEDFLGSPVGNVIVRNCHTKLLLRQEEVAIPAVQQTFGLSAAECDLLRDAGPGAGLVLVGRDRAAFQGAAPAEFHPWLCTDARPLTTPR
ncbi:MAG: VirB4 family type IV secretion system protein [Candidatus Dormibacteria bacterium]